MIDNVMQPEVTDVATKVLNAVFAGTMSPAGRAQVDGGRAERPAGRPARRHVHGSARRRLTRSRPAADPAAGRLHPADDHRPTAPLDAPARGPPLHAAPRHEPAPPVAAPGRHPVRPARRRPGAGAARAARSPRRPTSASPAGTASSRRGSACRTTSGCSATRRSGGSSLNNLILLAAVPLAIFIPLLVAYLLNEHVLRLAVLPLGVLPADGDLLGRHRHGRDPLLRRRGDPQRPARTLGHRRSRRTCWAASYSAMLAVTITFIWSVFGTNTIIFITGMATLDREVYEAARVDGASAFTTFRKITIPMLMRFIQFAFILTLITAFTALFSLIFVMTGGGPGLRLHDARVLRLPAGLQGGRVRLRRRDRHRAVRGRVRDQPRASCGCSAAGWTRRRLRMARPDGAISRGGDVRDPVRRRRRDAVPVRVHDRDRVPVAATSTWRAAASRSTRGRCCSPSCPVVQQLWNSTVVTVGGVAADPGRQHDGRLRLREARLPRLGDASCSRSWPG